MPPFQDLTGRRFGRLVVLWRATTSRFGDTRWMCQCDCGSRKSIRANALGKRTYSCGCLVAQQIRENCSVLGCDRRHYGKGLCALHYARYRRTGTTDARPVGKYVGKHVTSTSIEWEHRLIAAKALGRPLPTKVHVHHWDNNGRNNTNKNLVICQDIAYHKLLHRRQRIKNAGGDPNTDAWCSRCQAPRPLSMFTTRKTGSRAGAPVSHCHTCASQIRKDRRAAAGRP